MGLKRATYASNHSCVWCKKFPRLESIQHLYIMNVHKIFLFHILMLFTKTSSSMQHSAILRLAASGFRLVHHVIRTYNSPDALNCAQNCLAKQPFCKSINFDTEKQFGSGMNCELNNATKLTRPKNLQPVKNVHYYEVVEEVKSKVKQDRNSNDSSAMKGNNSFHANFTNLGASGRLGPKLLGTHYAGKDNENMVTVQNGTQFWTVPHTGTYEITAVGATGGYQSSFLSTPDRGAYMKGEFDLKKGHVIKILVGQSCETLPFCGGGGGTFVATSSNTPIIVAGGGGGCFNIKTLLPNSKASTGTFGRSNACGGNCSIISGGVNGNGSLNVHDVYSCGGGGGFYGDGPSSRYGGGKAFVNGGEGGDGYSVFDGGFGGGGGGGGGQAGAGGFQGGRGGGYSGGAPGVAFDNSCGGGGGSFNNGRNQLNKEGYPGGIHGFVEIKLLI
ncbi:ALK tyrosine kinase receptor-like [Dendronephthya gigantea]|uniref:ALK tyrosine kinase receptor-like n=1 Tax=Dendronephthya gigantea TaxID=151771 RepID=UPI00106C5437|nr:ALK tyrosine kinase receptor-like [Dendronephthya gigantea]